MNLAGAAGYRTSIDDIAAWAPFASFIEGVKLGSRKGRGPYRSRPRVHPEPVRRAHEYSAKNQGARPNHGVAGPLRLLPLRHEAPRSLVDDLGGSGLAGSRATLFRAFLGAAFHSGLDALFDARLGAGLCARSDFLGRWAGVFLARSRETEREHCGSDQQVLEN